MGMNYFNVLVCNLGTASCSSSSPLRFLEQVSTMIRLKKIQPFAYEGSFIENSNSTASSSENNHTAPLKNSDSLQQSSAWAVTKFIIQVPESSVRGSYLHKEAMKGNTFLSKILMALKDKPHRNGNDLQSFSE